MIQPKPIAQEHCTGCAVACVASACGISYAAALKLFTHQEHAGFRGYYCPEVVAALQKAGLRYAWRKVTGKNRALLRKEGAIVFVGSSTRYPLGHFLLKTRKGWMNIPAIGDVRAGFCSRLPGKAQWVIYPQGALG
ncbi:hypothetical protein COY28_05075 [Candidatus Woesearchaeota archaeon CG_4_10_14_0_2_um_filter_57_5]|nr:MAG: hypothetical protein AUJ68_04395 [Candidatus Woesearchaeota archaeon CG1_02_57_44]PIN68441.1 MAG: hypothetical protein COV94_04625 [Candidatus Woesearchaeota archaeon CG11_big_fil_rev_8_21_14_0_20_57_5]PIZ51320.1 MAG: hypothetical protein COY28_05075 [Candidatus Woesearchaeota archaeon CG_4_10_14_0_2_um_filter_57_5]